MIIVYGDEQRRRCVVCDSVLLTTFFEIAEFPVYMGTTTEPHKEDAFFDQEWQECADCNGVQLRNPISLEILYKENHHNQPIGKLWQDHHEYFARFVNKHRGESERILEIGAADGFLAGLILNQHPSLDYLVIEPAPTIKDTRVRIIQGYFEHNIEALEDRLIVHSHLLEHLYNPTKLFQILSDSMREGEITIFSIPNILELLKVFGTNSLNFEHTYFLSDEIIVFWAKKFGFEIIEREHFRRHSIFYCLKKNVKKDSSDLNLSILSQPKEKFMSMWHGIEEFANETSEHLKDLNQSAHIFGGHIFTQALLKMGLKEDLILTVLDNDPYKQGRRLYGTNLIVHDPKSIKDLIDVNVILVASHYQREIERQLRNLNPNVNIFALN